MKRINSHTEFKKGEFYWLISNAFGSRDVAECMGNTIQGHWITDTNYQYTMEKYQFYGPIPPPAIDGIGDTVNGM